MKRMKIYFVTPVSDKIQDAFLEVLKKMIEKSEEELWDNEEKSILID